MTFSSRVGFLDTAYTTVKLWGRRNMEIQGSTLGNWDWVVTNCRVHLYVARPLMNNYRNQRLNQVLSVFFSLLGVLRVLHW